jgi:Fur family peroxide stress response transcriptional regulator
MERPEEICRKHGLTLTVQRRVVLEELWGRKDHPTADQVFTSVSKKLPEISRTTVYRVLETFVRLGIARLVCHPGAATRYEVWTKRHHHLLCMRCEAIIDLELPSLDRIPLPETPKEFNIEDYSVEFRGVCSTCLRDASGRRAARGPLRRRARRAPHPN